MSSTYDEDMSVSTPADVARTATPVPPPPPPPPLPPTLAELFEREEIAAAARLLRVMDSEQVHTEIPQAFTLVPSAPSCFLRCMRLWVQQYGDDAVAQMLDVVETAVLSVRSMQQPSISELDAQLAGELLVALRECRAMLIANFALAFRVPESVLADFCLAAVHKHVFTGVQLLKALRMKHLVPPETVLLAAIDQKDVRAGDLFVRHNHEHQVLFVNLLLSANASDKAVKKRIKDFKLDASAFPSFVYQRKLATLRYLIYSEQYEAAENIARESRELQEYACRILVEKRGTAHPMTQYFVRAMGCAHAFPDVDVSDGSELLLPLQDEYEPLASYLSLVDCIGAANIVFVDTREALDACLDHLETQSAVGFDCEWKATHVAAAAATGSVNPCATLQLASAHRAFVIDILTLGDISETLAPLFRSDAVLKLGFATQGDLKLLRAILGKPRGGPDVIVSRLLDLQTVARKLYEQSIADVKASKVCDGTEGSAAVIENDETVSGEAIGTPATTVEQGAAVPHPKQPRKTRRGGSAQDNSVATLSLTGVTERYLGKPLDKRARMSNWERRPLTRAQLHYAALDAHVLVQIFAAMREQHAAELLESIVRRCTQKNVR